VVEVATCLHHPVGDPSGDPSLIGPCECRKPLPGLLLGLAERWNAEPARSFYLGDTEGDVRAARRAGFGAALVGPLRCDLCPLRGAPLEVTPDVVAPGFLELARAIVARERAL
jgi:D-glycero-D-manno-heptose 1,7-bisphosphate phosphatase